MPEDTLPKTLNAIKPLPSVERLRELLDYDPYSGVFTRKTGRGGRSAGTVAGCLHSAGYIEIKVDGVKYLAHRVAWKMMTESDPFATIDHENHIRDDNRFQNLRQATCSQQNMNTTARGSSKFLGVCWEKQNEKWRVKVGTRGNIRHIGYFTCEIEAALAYDAAVQKEFGEFAHLNFPEAS